MLKVEKEKDQHWKSVYFNLERKSGTSCDLATATLKDLHDMYVFWGLPDNFKEKMMEIREKYGRSTTLMNRFQKAGLPYKRK